MPHSHGFLHHLAHDFDRALEIEAFTGAHIQLQGDGIQLLLTVYRQVSPLGQVLADQAVDVLVAAALPGAVWVAEVDRHTGLLGDFRVPRHLSPLVVGHALAYSQRHAVQRRAEALHNLPEPGNAFLEELTLRNLTQLVAKHPQLRQPLTAAVQLPE